MGSSLMAVQEATFFGRPFTSSIKPTCSSDSFFPLRSAPAHRPTLCHCLLSPTPPLPFFIRTHFFALSNRSKPRKMKVIRSNGRRNRQDCYPSFRSAGEFLFRTHQTTPPVARHSARATSPPTYIPHPVPVAVCFKIVSDPRVFICSADFLSRAK